MPAGAVATRLACNDTKSGRRHPAGRLAVRAGVARTSWLARSCLCRFQWGAASQVDRVADNFRQWTRRNGRSRWVSPCATHFRMHGRSACASTISTRFVPLLADQAFSGCERVSVAAVRAQQLGECQEQLIRRMWLHSPDKRTCRGQWNDSSLPRVVISRRHQEIGP